MPAARNASKNRSANHSTSRSVDTGRVSFAKIAEPLEVPDLLALQSDSFDWLIGSDRWQAQVAEAKSQGRTDVSTKSGLEEIFEEISPIEDFSGTMSLSFRDHRFEPPKNTVDECKERDFTYSAPLFVTAEFMNNETGEIKSQTVFMGDFPLMTENGTFIVNGTERVVVSQLVRSPGVYFERSIDKTSDKDVFTAKMIPSRGAWLEFEIDKRDMVGVRLDRKRKQNVTVLLKALGWTEAQILEEFGQYESIRLTLEKDHTSGQDDALLDIYRKLRPGEPPTKEAAQTLLDNYYFNPKRYDLAKVGRYKINKKLGREEPFDKQTLTTDDIVAAIHYIVALHDGQTELPDTRSTAEQDATIVVEADDIDHFGNRRLRTVGELIQNQLRTGLARMERVVRERMTTQDVEAITPQTLINIRPVVAALKEFFGTSQLSQFMDQINPLAGLTHKRRLSALGPGGLSRERAGFEVRDVHPSHYGRMCPIETPEGPNIGLIGSLSTYGRVNSYGFVETPYRKVVDGIVTTQIDYLTADEEDRVVIAQANAPLSDDNHFVEDRVLVRERRGEVDNIPGIDVDYMDVSPRQMVSVGTALIPFLEHDDANRALMGSNMQRQAVPLIRAEAPLVGTGMEYRAAVDAGDVVVAKAAGVRDRGQRRLRRGHGGRRPLRDLPAGQVQALQPGHLRQPAPVRPPGRPGRGRLADRRRAQHRLGRDGARAQPAGRLHAVGGPQLRGRDHPQPAAGPGGHPHLDPHRGARGRRPRHQARPRGDHPRHPQRLRRDACRPRRARHHPDRRRGRPGRHPGRQGHAQGRDRADPRGAAAARDLRREGARGARHVAQGQARRERHRHRCPRLRPRGGRRAAARRQPADPRLRRTEAQDLRRRQARRTPRQQGRHLEDPAGGGHAVPRGRHSGRHHPEPARRAGPDEHRPGPGDPPRVDRPRGLAGRGRQRGVAEAPRPTSAPRRRRATRGSRPRSSTAPARTRSPACSPSTMPNRDGERLVKGNGKANLFDGRTGEPFPAPVAVGYTYIIKLNHLVDDKIHARSTGPYSMITQQPLGGKAQFGGQRFGEMEVWALEAYGAAYALQELLTIKSDDVLGRVKVYEAIVKGENIPEPGIPESFKVLVKEMQSLCLNVEVLSSDGVAMDMRDTDEDVFRAAEELGIDLARRPNEGISSGRRSLSRRVRRLRL